MKRITLLLLLSLLITNVFSQKDDLETEYFGTFGIIVVGINKANEILSPDNPYLSNDQIKSRTTLQAEINFQVKPYDGFGFGLDAEVVGIDFIWSRGLKDISYGYIAPHTSRNSSFSLVFRLMFPS